VRFYNLTAQWLLLEERKNHIALTVLDRPNFARRDVIEGPCWKVSDKTGIVVYYPLPIR